jgi:transposase-like protein
MVYNRKELKETQGFRTFKKDYIRIFNKHHSDLIGVNPKTNMIRIYKKSDHQEESLLNYLNTNLLTYEHMVNETLKQIDFNPLTKTGYEEMMTFILENKDFWISMLPKFNSIITFTTGRGNQSETLVVNKLINHFNGKFKVETVGGIGSSDDMKKGIDVRIISLSKTFNGQIKVVKSISLNEEKYLIPYNGINKDYNNIDYMIFVENDKVYVFDKNVVVSNEDGYESEKSGLKLVL